MALVLLITHEPGRQEVAFAKGIPATPENEKLIGDIARVIPLKRRFRGPRIRAGRKDYNARSYCLKAHATHISLYERPW